MKTTTTQSSYTRVDAQKPPRDTLIEWISPSGIVERGRWLGGSIWMPEGSNMYVYYTPVMWRLI